MRRLLLLRHAKASPATPKSDDHDRPLAARGRVDAPRIGAEMKRRGFLPQLVLCSTARRTRETWDGVAPELGGRPRVEFTDELYLAPGKAIADLVRGTHTKAEIVLVVGHNPGLEDCADALARHPRASREQARLSDLAEKFPTGALAVLAFDIGDWAEMQPGSGILVDFLRPKEL